VRRGALLADGTERPLRPKSFALLRHLAERAGQLVGRDEIMEAVWPGTFVTEAPSAYEAADTTILKVLHEQQSLPPGQQDSGRDRRGDVIGQVLL
jgi:DNA-binding winged helix-turn-helix (wHTH) protein